MGTHTVSFPSTVGDLDFGLASSGAFLNCKGDERALAGVPPVRIFVMGENRWRGYEEWPVPGSREEKWYLRADRE